MSDQPYKIILKSNVLIHAHSSFDNVNEGRLLLRVIEQVKKDDAALHTYTISVKSILGMNYSGSKKKSLERAVDLLMDRKITLPNDDNGWIKYRVFAKVEYKDQSGLVEVQFHPDLIPYYLDAKERFTRLNAKEFFKLRTIKHQRIYEILSSWNFGEHAKGTVKNLKIGELHEMLDSPDSERKNFAEFERKTLKPAQKQIHEKTTLMFDYEEIKEGRAGKIVSIDFAFTEEAKAKLKKNQKELPPEIVRQNLRKEAADCFKNIYQKHHQKCTPQQDDLKCQICCEIGYMYARRHKEEQLPIPFEETLHETTMAQEQKSHNLEAKQEKPTPKLLPEEESTSWNFELVTEDDLTEEQKVELAELRKKKVGSGSRELTPQNGTPHVEGEDIPGESTPDQPPASEPTSEAEPASGEPQPEKGFWRSLVDKVIKSSPEELAELKTLLETMAQTENSHTAPEAPLEPLAPVKKRTPRKSKPTEEAAIPPIEAVATEKLLGFLPLEPETPETVKIGPFNVKPDAPVMKLTKAAKKTVKEATEAAETVKGTVKRRSKKTKEATA